MTSISSVIEKDLAWREAEIASIKMAIISSPTGSIAERTLLRAAWALLYAHYEGFCKFAWDTYLDAIQNTLLRRRDCKDEIASFSLTKEFSKVKDNLSHQNIWEFCTDTFDQLLDENIYFHKKLKTNSNLYPDLLCSNCDKLLLNHSIAETYKIKLKILVERRNAIAHGEKLEIRSIAEYQDYENAALLVMHELAVEIVEAIDNKAYRR